MQSVTLRSIAPYESRLYHDGNLACEVAERLVDTRPLR